MKLLILKKAFHGGDMEAFFRETSLPCPDFKMWQYLKYTAHVKTENLVVNSRPLAPCSRVRISQLTGRIVKIFQRGI